jgi:hypothetical protein
MFRVLTNDNTLVEYSPGSIAESTEPWRQLPCAPQKDASNLQPVIGELKPMWATCHKEESGMICSGNINGWKRSVFESRSVLTFRRAPSQQEMLVASLN